MATHQLTEAMQTLGVTDPADSIYNLKEEEHIEVKDEGMMSFIKRLLSFKGDFDSIGVTAPLSIQEPATRIDMLGRVEVTPLLALDQVSTATDVERIIAVSKTIFAQLGMGNSCKKKPLNSLIFENNVCGFAPSLGTEQTFKCKYARGINVGDKYEQEGRLPVTLIAEQVSHHPPISASCIQTDNVVWMNVDYFKGQLGTTSLMLVNKGYSYITLKKLKEVYNVHMSDAIVVPRGSFFSGVADMVWTGDLTIRCEGTGLESILTFPKKKLFTTLGSEVKGGIRKIGSKNFLYEYSGDWHKDIFISEVGKKEKTIIATTNVTPKYVQVIPPHLEPNHVLNLWGPIYQLMKAGKFDEATKIKTALENRQRKYFKQMHGKEHRARYFEKDIGGEWKLKPTYNR
jgi:hypothetical protein